MKCVGQRGKRKHCVVPDNGPAQDDWHERCVNAGKALLARSGVLDGPLSVEITFTVPKPASVPTSRQWPVTRSSGDIDKLARLALDALDSSGLFRDDSQVVELTLRKAYPHTPAPDLCDDQGALIRIWKTEI